MKFFANSRIGTLLLLLVAPSTLFAQNGALDKLSNDTNALNARQIVALSIAAAQRSWLARNRIVYIVRDEDRRLNSLGQVESQNVDVSRMLLVNGARFEQLMEHNGQIPSARDERKSSDDLAKLKHESAAERNLRLSKDQENSSFLPELLQAFDFELIGEEISDGRPAYVLHATPHRGYTPHGRYGKMLTKVEGKLWVDKQDFGWIKVDGQVTQSFSMGLFVARVQRGSHILMQQICIGDAVWVPTRLEIRASAKIFFLKSLEMDKILTYSDYRPASDGPYAVSR